MVIVLIVLVILFWVHSFATMLWYRSFNNQLVEIANALYILSDNKEGK